MDETNIHDSSPSNGLQYLSFRSRYIPQTEPTTHHRFGRSHLILIEFAEQSNCTSHGYRYDPLCIKCSGLQE
jgi:hypothetical protein